MKFIYCAILSFYTVVTQAQITLQDVRSEGAASALLLIADTIGISSNPAANAELKNLTLCLSTRIPYLMRSLQQHSFAAGVPLNKNVWTTSVSRTGRGEYGELKVTTELSKKLGNKIKAGIRLNYQRWQYEDGHYPDEQAVYPSAGVIVVFQKGLTFGCRLENIRSLFGKSTTSLRTLPGYLQSGLSMQVSEQITLAVSAFQNGNYPFSGGIGCEYSGRLFAMRCGINMRPFSPTFGFSCFLKKYRIDTACIMHPQLGTTLSTAFYLSL